MSEEIRVSETNAATGETVVRVFTKDGYKNAEV